MVGDVLHVLDVWDSAENMDTFMRKLGPVGGSRVELAAAPVVGDVINIVRAPDGSEPAP